MKQILTRNKTLHLVFLFTIFSTSSIYSFNGLFQTAFGARQAGMGGAFLSVGGSVMDLESNPSHLGSLKEKKIEAGSSFHFANLKFEDQFQSSNPELNYSNKSESHPIAPLPYIGFISPITEGLGWGIALYTQAGGGGVFKNITKNTTNANTLNELVGANDPWIGNSRQIHQDFSFKFITNKITPALGFELGNFSLGAGVDLIISKMMFDRIYKDITNTYELPGTFRYESAISYSLGGKVGMSYKISPETKIAYSFISGNTTYLDGSMEVYTTKKEFPVQNVDVSKSMSLPPRHQAGISKKFGQLLVAFDIKYIQWSKGFSSNKFILERPMIPTPLGIDTNTIQFRLNWKDQTVFAIGAEYSFKKNYFFRLGYNYGKTPLSSYGVNPLIGTTTEHHASLGFGAGNENTKFNLAVEYAFPNKVSGRKNSDWAIANSVFSRDNIQIPAYSHSKTVNVASLYLGIEKIFN